ncbi:hypothetical protein [Arthrobacter sp. CJ23]|uniref:hypothetical protein n=1 Tax=Arthrobacter sp. CJ23 TaxID=2972479 RepID=UPI00215BDE21|nr:hypothetical protein [Arthrobacter sp. CJ23]UVJ38605.1 hypothetical protein NVV90_15445 [Arthrobacter sp. CJ23]
MATLTKGQDTSLGFGIAEMAYILQLQSTPASVSSTRWLRLGDEAEDHDLIRAGLSSLIARGLASVDKEGQISFDQRVDVVAYTLAAAARWTQIDLLQSAELGDTVLHVESDKTKLLLQPRTMQAWFALPQDPAISAEAAEAFLVREHLTEHADGGVRLRTSGPEGDFQLVVRKDTRGWVCAAVDGDTVGAEIPVHGDADLLQVLAGFRSGTLGSND